MGGRDTAACVPATQIDFPGGRLYLSLRRGQNFQRKFWVRCNKEIS